MIAAVTGATGFVGRALVGRLSASGEFAEIRILSRRATSGGAVKSFTGDLTDAQLDLSAFLDGVDVLFHCAGEIRNEPLMRPLHVEGTRRLLLAAQGRIRKWIQLSSVGVYGRASRRGVIDENAAPAPEGAYEITKAEADALVGDCRAFETVTLRPSIIFGPGMPNRSLHQLVATVRRRLFFFSNKNAVANYVYVDDVAEALHRCAAESATKGVYNLSDDRPMPQFIAAIARALGVPTPTLYVPEFAARALVGVLGFVPRFPLTRSRLDALTREVSYPAARIRHDTGFSFTVSIEEGLRRFVAAQMP